MEKQKKVLKWLETALPKMISKYDVQEQTDNEKELYEWVKKQADDNAKNRYHSKIDCSILTAYKQGFIRGFYFLYNKLKNFTIFTHIHICKKCNYIITESD